MADCIYEASLFCWTAGIINVEVLVWGIKKGRILNSCPLNRLMN
jgi:hypothetical protein